MIARDLDNRSVCVEPKFNLDMSLYRIIFIMTDENILLFKRP